ncbi:MFS transporter [Conexibacter arvalis]|uniref:EmrB/QacA subfamily drug resistance transporter n=1 Tax=Conexibacter arvalis TaxID=912552 RepID=A0A840IIT1_9ACTN|nr:MFS transporter [Conexibacter arvalis]MBB4664131.1 EmrB/QacA subfamily drug resistance transporter [Conexibacter arvalis]
MTQRIRALRLTEDNRRWWTLGAMCFALFMLMLDNTVVNVALPSIQQDLDADLAALEWTINAYTLSLAVLLVVGGRLGDIFGRRRIFLIGVTVFALSSAAIGLSPTDTALIVGRAIQGIGAAMMMPATLSIVTNAFPPHERGRALGTWAGVSALALAIGPVVGGFLTEHVSWRAIFFLNLPVAAAAIAVSITAVRESRDETVGRTIDYAGIATLTVGLTALVLGLIEANRWGWGSPRILALFALAVAALAAFALVERRVKAPMVDFAVFRSRQFAGAASVGFIVSFGMMAMFFFTALYMQNILGYSALEAGVRFLPTTLVLIVMGPLAGRLTDTIGPKPLLVSGMLITGASQIWQSFLTSDTGYGFLLPSFVLMGVGMGLVMSPMTTAAMNAVDRTKAGVASGVLSMGRMVGSSLGVAIFGAVVATVGSAKLDEALPSLPAPARERLAESLGGGGVAGGPQQIVEASRDAFISAFGTGMKISGAIAIAGAFVALALISGGRPTAPEPVPELAPEPEPEPAAA